MTQRVELSLSKKIVFSFIPLFILVILIESFFRIFPIHTETKASLSGFIIQDKDLGWRLKPNNSGPLQTNELGLRDTTYNKLADKKILLLGDSVSWGDGINNTKAVYPYLLEQKLNANSGKTHEVINSGVPGYSTFQQLRFLELKGLKLEPDLIILQFCLNDVIERYSTLAAYGGDNVFLGVDTRSMIPGLHGWLIKYSRSYEALVREIMSLARNKQEYEVEKLASDDLSEELEKAWAITIQEIDKIRKIAEANNIPLILMVAPYRFQLDNPSKTSQPQQLLMEYAQKNNIVDLNLLAIFSQYKKQYRDISLFNDKNHFSVSGHALVASILFQLVSRVEY